MEKNEILIEYDAKYASLVMDELPIGNIDKTNAGCGMTSLALENNLDTIILVPSIYLIKNKLSQYPNDRCDYRMIGVYGDIGMEDVEQYVSEIDTPIKILCTYDSAWKLENYFDRCRIVIDESQNILKAQKLKASNKSELNDTNIMIKLDSIIQKYSESVSLISAHPAPIEYMSEAVQNLPQIKITWSKKTTVTPILINETYTNKALKELIIEPLIDSGQVNVGSNAIAKKAIIFMNSVNGIIKVIKDCGIQNESEVIAADTYQNSIRLKQENIKRLSNPKELPKYTFLTSSGISGIDLYDKEAVSIVVSNTGSDFTMMDMKLDLGQAISRNRDVPYDKFFFIYNQKQFENSEEDMLKKIEENKDSILDNIDTYEYQQSKGTEQKFMSTPLFRMYTYLDAESNLQFNNSLFESDRYFILNVISKFRDGFDICGLFDDSIIVEKPIKPRRSSFKDAVLYYEKHVRPAPFIAKNRSQKKYTDLINQYALMYPDKSIPLTERNTKKLVDIFDLSINNKIDYEVLEYFKVGKIYSRQQIKQKLADIYKANDFKHNATAEDIREWFAVKNRQGKDKVKSFELLEKSLDSNFKVY